MILYGDADLETVLRFLDEKHLSRFKSRNLNLRPLFEGPVSSGFRKQRSKVRPMKEARLNTPL